MYFLVTDDQNKSWQGRTWGQNVTHEEANDNYFFHVYRNGLVAALMYPCYEGEISPKIWTAQGERMYRDCGFRVLFPKLTTLEEVAYDLPKDEQHVTFGILCCMYLVQNPVFKEWAMKWLKNEDRSKEAAGKVSEELMNMLGTEIPVEHEYYACGFAALQSVISDKPKLYAANAAHRAWHDAMDEKTGGGVPLDIAQAAQIALTLPPADIAAALS